MAQRREVFQSKVLRKLYPAPPKEETCTTQSVEFLPQTTAAKRTVCEDTKIGNTSTPVKRLYTVLPPPPNYKTDIEESVTHTELESLNSVEDPAENRELESSDQTDQAKETEEKKRRRKRKKRKDAVTELNQAAVTEGEECISKNKKRKLKKKRHKEKLLSMGLMPQAAAVEFTYQREELQQKEEDEEEKKDSSQMSEKLR